MKALKKITDVVMCAAYIAIMVSYPSYRQTPVQAEIEAMPSRFHMSMAEGYAKRAEFFAAEAEGYARQARRWAWFAVAVGTVSFSSWVVRCFT